MSLFFFKRSLILKMGPYFFLIWVPKSESAVKPNLANFYPDQIYLLFDKIAQMWALFAKLEWILLAWKFRKVTDNALLGVLKSTLHTAWPVQRF